MRKAGVKSVGEDKDTDGQTDRQTETVQQQRQQRFENMETKTTRPDISSAGIQQKVQFHSLNINTKKQQHRFLCKMWLLCFLVCLILKKTMN